jgi:protein-S-isoprenylcysteine O-methyltransferase Ste14
MMQATDFEFRNRWWLFGVIFGVSFVTFAFDRKTTGEHIADVLASAASLPNLTAVRIVFAVGAFIMIVAALIRTWGSAYLGRDVVHDKDVHSETLRADGPYRHVRNPLYFGNELMAVAVGLIAPYAGCALMLIGITLFNYRLIGREEAFLTAQQGDRYREFLQAVPRLWPSLRARIAPAGAAPDWVNGLSAEAYFWSFALGLVAFAIFLNIICFYAGLTFSPLLSWLAGLATRNRYPAKA